MLCVKFECCANRLSYREPAAFVTFFIGEGDNPTKFLVHKEFACHYSPVLKRAFNSEFVEGQTQTYRLEDTTEQAFRLLVQWLYSQKFELPLGEYKDNGQIIDPEVMRALMAEENSLAELWVLADKLCIPALQNLVIDTIHMICSVRERVPASTYRYIYENTESGSPLRRLVVTYTVRYIDQEGLLGESDFYPRQMLLDLSAFLLCMPKEALFNQPLDLSDYYVPLDSTSQ